MSPSPPLKIFVYVRGTPMDFNALKPFIRIAVSWGSAFLYGFIAFTLDAPVEWIIGPSLLVLIAVSIWFISRGNGWS